MYLSIEIFACLKEKKIALYLSVLKQFNLSYTVWNQISTLENSMYPDKLISLVNSVDPDQLASLAYYIDPDELASEETS